MSLSILIETMRREGYELQVSPPRVLYQEVDGGGAGGPALNLPLHRGVAVEDGGHNALALGVG